MGMKMGSIGEMANNRMFSDACGGYVVLHTDGEAP
jgi:hypothetical protein